MENTYTNTLTLAERVKERLSALRMNKAELALKLNLSRPYISQYLNNKYASDATAIEEALERFLEDPAYQVEGAVPKAQQKGGSVPAKVEYYESRDYVNVIGLCQSCQDNQTIGMIVGKSGYGKTHALKSYAKMPRVAYIECDDTMACRDLVEAMESALGMPRAMGGTIWNRINKIREFFKVNNGYLLIIDEADKLISKYTTKKMEILRGIFDQSEVALIVAGEPKLESDIKGLLPRLGNRTEFYYKLRGLSQEEVKDYFQGFQVEEQAMNELVTRACNTKSGCFRLLDRTLNNAMRIMRERNETRVTIKIINDASRMMML